MFGSEATAAVGSNGIVSLARGVENDDCIAYRVPEAARVIGVSVREMYRLVDNGNGEIPSIKYGEHRTSPRVVMREDLVAWVRSKAKPKALPDAA